MKVHLKKKIKELLHKLKVKNEASMTGTAPVASGPVAVGGDAARTPFAFSKRGTRPSTYNQLGYKLAKNIKKSPNFKLENQVYSQPSYTTPSFNIEPTNTYFDKNGLVQHNDPNIDPNLIGYKQGNLPVTEGFNGLKYEQEGQKPLQQNVKQSLPTNSVQPLKQQSVTPPTQSAVQPSVNIKNYDVLPDFTSFDTKLKSSTESLKNNLQKTIQDKILGKKIVVRASKGYKQPETDYTINVTGVAIDYYYDRYVIIIIGREENKQKVAKFFIKPGFSIKILGTAELKPKDKYQVAKSQALVSPQQSATPTNTVTSDEEEASKTPDETSSKNQQQSPTQVKV
jgi:hypothetical protein